METRELWFTGPDCVEVHMGAVPRTEPGRLLVQALASGISQGTELLLLRGEGTEPFDPSLADGANPTYPCRYGYCWVGEVIDCASDVSDFALGERVFALVPHGDVHLLSPSQVRRVDRKIPATREVLAANLETAITCVWDSGACIGDNVVVLGGGVVGLLIAWLLLKIGAEVLVIEPADKRRAVARQLGVSKAAVPEDDCPIGVADIVIEATGNPSTLDSAIAHAGQEARIVVVSNYGMRRYPVDLGSHFHRRRLTIKSTQVSSIPPERTARWSLDRRFALVRQLLDDHQLDVLIDNIVEFNDAPEAYSRLQREPGSYLQTVFRY